VARIPTARSGQRRNPVTLENLGAPVSDGEGGFTQVPTALSPSTTWAQIVPATARDLERVLSNVVESNASHIVTIPYHPQVTTKTRLTFGTRIFQVTGMQNPEERNIELVLACTEVIA
jgi:SPP1 family predicted phage head-tail adaptor